MHVVMITREFEPDKKYGLGRSLTPLVDGLNALNGVHAEYFCQSSLQATHLAQRQRWLDRLSCLPGLRNSPGRRLLLGALAERLQTGWCGTKQAIQSSASHVHAHDPWLALGVWLCIRVHRIERLRWGFTQHGYGSYSRATHDDGLFQGPSTQRWLRRLEGWISGKAHFVVAPTQASLQALARDLAFPQVPSHWRHIPHPKRMDLQAKPPELAVKPRLRVLGVGRLVPLKQFDVLVRACVRLSHTLPIELHILGEGHHQPLLDLAANTPLAEHFQLRVSTQIAEEMHQADVYVSTSSTESFGLANLEALCSGLPMVCTAVGGVPEVLGDAAWLVPLDEHVIEAALHTMLYNPQVRQQWATRAQQRAQFWPTPIQVTHLYHSLYSHVAQTV